MSPKELQAKQVWLGAAVERLTLLCDGFMARAEDHDVLPTEKQKLTVVEFLKLVDRTDAPRMGTTANADLTLLWVTANDKYKVYVERNGSQHYFHNKTEVQKNDFLRLVARVLA